MFATDEKKTCFLPTTWLFTFNKISCYHLSTIYSDKSFFESQLTLPCDLKKNAEAKPTRNRSSEARQMMETRSVEVAPRQTRRARGRLRHSVPPTRLRLVFLVWLRRFAPPTCRLNRLEIIDFCLFNQVLFFFKFHNGNL